MTSSAPITDQKPLPGLPTPDTADVRAGAPFIEYDARSSFLRALDGYRVAQSLLPESGASLDEVITALEAVNCLGFRSVNCLLNLDGMAGAW